MREYGLRLDEYGISGDRYKELLHMCRQYDEMRSRLDRIRAGADSPRPSGGGARAAIKDPTGNRAARAADSRDAVRVNTIEQAAVAADPAVCRFILRNVTRGVSYDQMAAAARIPCGREAFYALRRKFFWLLDQMLV